MPLSFVAQEQGLYEFHYRGIGSMLCKSKNIFRDLCQEVLDYYEGRGKYNFSHLNPHDRDNAAFDAWQLIRERIKQALTDSEGGVQ